MPAARVEFKGVWKKFRRGTLHDSLRDVVPSLIKRLASGPRKDDPLGRHEFWALGDVSFEVAPGETLGILGPNGSGKSTILKLLTGILRPDRGRVQVRGRKGALIEIAAGFHPDLTGRENVFLQGAIMGMRRSEIARQFSRIVEFAELEEFIDTQVKRYSSGMNARLGFAIAAHLDPEVLIIDEILSVGDRSFQRKAFDRIAEIARRDISVVLVSHQLEHVASLCSKAILLGRGRVVRAGTPSECIAHYLTEGLGDARAIEGRPLRLERLTLEPSTPVRSGAPLRAQISGAVLGAIPETWRVALRVKRAETDETLFSVTRCAAGIQLPPAGRFELVAELEAHLAGGLYLVEAAVWDAHAHRDVSSGLRRMLHVRADHDFQGSVNLHPRFELEVPVPWSPGEERPVAMGRRG
jgi:lipopolysaccharide transport system ATP-binding protein